MNVHFRFPLTRPIVVTDSWPLEGYGAEVVLERHDDEARAIVVTFRDQPLSLAPQIIQTPHQATKARIEIKDALETTAAYIVKRLASYINLYQTLEVRVDDVEVTYEGTTDEERAQIHLKKFNRSRRQAPRRFLFSMLAQAFYAGEAGQDPSFVSHMSSLAREALIDGQYIDAFRYAFMLCEALYGDGKFKTVQLVKAMYDDAAFRPIVENTIKEFATDQLHQRSTVRQFVAQYATAQSMIEHLVDRRGFYFHGNLARKDAWHPDRQAVAKDLAEFAVGLASSVAHSFSEEMFKPEIERRHFKNAKAQGAIMTLSVEFVVRDAHGLDQRGSFKMNLPGTKPTNAMALFAQSRFLEWAEVELSDKTLLSAVVTDEKSGRELFRSQYLDSGASKANSSAA